MLAADGQTPSKGETTYFHCRILPKLLVLLLLLLLSLPVRLSLLLLLLPQLLKPLLLSLILPALVLRSPFYVHWIPFGGIFGELFLILLVKAKYKNLVITGQSKI